MIRFINGNHVLMKARKKHEEKGIIWKNGNEKMARNRCQIIKIK